jgi:hypothetical protein
METAAFKGYLFGFHVFLYLPAAIVLTRVLWNQLRLVPVQDPIMTERRIHPAYFLSTLFLLVFAALFLVFGFLLLISRDAILPPVLHQAAGIGCIFYWFLLSCFVAQWGKCFG